MNASAMAPIAVSPPDLATASWTFMYSHSGRNAAVMMTMLRQSLIAAGLSLPKTTGTRSVVRRPNNSIITPSTTEPDRSHVFCFFASSSLPAPRVLPSMTLVAAVVPPNDTKKRFAIAKPAAIPETTSAPPLPLYTAVVTVSDRTHVISLIMTMKHFLTMSLNSGLSIPVSSCGFITNGGLSFAQTII